MKKEWTSGMGQFIAMLSQLYGFVSHVWSSMGIGMEIIPWLKTERGKKQAERILRLIGDEFLKFRACKWQVWKTIRIGAINLQRALRGTIIQFDQKVDELLNVPVNPTRETVDLVLVSGADLGFSSEATRNEIFSQAIKQGLQICPAEVGPHLRLQYEDQPIGERLFIAMDPIADSEGVYYLFYLKRIEDLWLFAHDKSADHELWKPEVRWVFILPA